MTCAPNGAHEWHLLPCIDMSNLSASICMRKPEKAHWVLNEHAVVGAQKLSNQQLEELLLDAPCINAVLSDEMNPERLEEVLRPLPCNLIQSILDGQKYDV